MELGKVWLDALKIGQRYRALVPERVEALAESMDALGLQQPVTVYMDESETVHLVAGLHRVEAARKLGWEQIDASFIKMSPARREMWEIAENLFRVDLSKEQRDEHIRRYAELLAVVEVEATAIDEKPRQSVAVSENKGGRGKVGVARRIAQETGISTRTVQRVLNPQPKPVPPPAPPHNPMEAYNKWAAEMNRAWSRAPQEWRERWLDSIDTPVMDQSADDLGIPEFLRRSH